MASVVIDMRLASLSSKELRRLARELAAFVEHSGGQMPDSLGPRQRETYDALVREWSRRGVQLTLF